MQASPNSRLSAAITEEIDSYWLLLANADQSEMEVSSWLMNAPSAPAEPAQEPYRSLCQPPPLPAEYLLSGGVLSTEMDGKWSLQWADSGNIAIASLNDVVIGIAKSGSSRGWARYVANGGDPWAKPFNDPECPFVKDN